MAQMFPYHCEPQHRNQVRMRVNPRHIARRVLDEEGLGWLFYGDGLDSQDTKGVGEWVVPSGCQSTLCGAPASSLATLVIPGLTGLPAGNKHSLITTQINANIK